MSIVKQKNHVFLDVSWNLNQRNNQQGIETKLIKRNSLYNYLFLCQYFHCKFESELFFIP